MYKKVIVSTLAISALAVNVFAQVRGGRMRSDYGIY